MSDRMTLALAQINPTVGDIAGNVARILDGRREAAGQGADLVIYGELSICGYPPEDLVLKPRFVEACARAVQELAQVTADGGPALLVGAPWVQDKRLYNAVLLLDGGRVLAVRLKHDLPNYGVFDEKRVFTPGPLQGPVEFRGVRLGLMICEDMWFPEVAECLQETGAEILLVVNGSPYDVEKPDERFHLARARVEESGLPLAYVHQVGGQDELVFDGASFVLNADLSLALQLPSFREALVVTRWRREGGGWISAEGERAAPPPRLEGIWLAMMLGLRDYVRKNRFPGVVLGLSGGIDSALSAAVAVDALGAERVRTVMLPYLYTSQDSLEDAAACAALLGLDLGEIPIAPAVEAMAEMLAPAFAGRKPGLAEENIQSRLRGVTLMALSNKLGHMVLTTGNKSENSVGYATLYGDMCGGFNVLKDVYKTTVFELADWRNRHRPAGALGPVGPVMPERIITKPPTAELRADQKDEDSLPPYAVLDAVLERLIEGEKGVDEIAAEGFDRALVQRIESLLYTAEYKRRQAAPGVKITRKNFGRDRRYPMTNGFRDRNG